MQKSRTIYQHKLLHMWQLLWLNEDEKALHAKTSRELPKPVNTPLTVPKPALMFTLLKSLLWL